MRHDPTDDFDHPALPDNHPLARVRSHWLPGLSRAIWVTGVHTRARKAGPPSRLISRRPRQERGHVMLSLLISSFAVLVS